MAIEVASYINVPSGALTTGSRAHGEFRGSTGKHRLLEDNIKGGDRHVKRTCIRGEDGRTEKHLHVRVLAPADSTSSWAGAISEYSCVSREEDEGHQNTYPFYESTQPMQREDTQALLSAYLSILERKEEKKRKEKPSRKDEGLRINVIEQCLQYHSNGEQIPRTPPSGYERDIVVRPCGTPGTRPTPPPQLLPPAGPYQYEINDPDGEFLDLRWEECTADVFLGATAAQKGFTLQASEKKRSSFDRLSETCSVVHNIRTPLRRVVTAVTDPHAIEYWVYLARVEGERIEARAEARARVEAERLQAVAESQFNGETSDDEQEDYQDEAEDNAEEGKAEEIFDFLLVALQESAENEQIDGESGEEFDGICHGEELEWDSDSDSDWDSGKLDVPDDVESG